MSDNNPRSKRWGSAAKKASATSEPVDDDDESMTAVGNGGDANNRANPNDLDEESIKKAMTAHGVLITTTQVRAETIDATTRVLRDLETIRAIEEEALTILHKDLEKVYNIEVDLNKIGGTMDRAREQIKALGRKLVRDACFKVMCTLLICTIIVVVVLVVTDGFGKITGLGGGNKVVEVTDPPATTTTTKAAAAAAAAAEAMSKQ